MLKVKSADFKRAFWRGFFNVGDVAYAPEPERDINVTEEAHQMLHQAWRDVGDSIRQAMDALDALPEYNTPTRNQ